MERTASLAVSAMQTIAGMLREVFIVASGLDISGPGQVVVLVDQPNIQSGRAGLAMVAINTDAFNFLGLQLINQGIVTRLFGGFHLRQDQVKIFNCADAWQHTHHSWPVQGILQTLTMGERLVKHGRLFIEQLTSAKRLHDGNSNTSLLCQAVKLRPFLRLAHAVFALLVVVGGIDAEHKLVHQSRIDQLAGNDWVV